MLGRIGHWLLTLLLPLLLAATLLLSGTAQPVEPRRGLSAWTIDAPLAEHRTVRLLFGGDVMLARGVLAECRERGDYTWPLREIAPLSTAADLFFCNLESLFREHPLAHPPHLLFQLPADSLAALTAAGIDVVSLANNHAGNVGAAGMAFSRELLENAGIACCGGGRDLAEAHAPAILDLDGLRVALLAYTSAASLTAGESTPGHSAWGLDLLERDIAALPADIELLVVSHHGGVEYRRRPTELQLAFARRAVELGADVVVGHHPHVLEPMELVDGALVCHSLGNLAMDQDWNPTTERTALIEVRCRGGRPRRIVVHPLLISSDYQPRPADEKTAAEVLERLGLDGGRLVVN